MTYLMLALPIIITVFFNMAIGRDPKNIRIGVVNNEIDIKRCANYTFKHNNNCFLDEKMFGSCQIIYQLHKRSYKVVSIDKIDFQNDPAHVIELVNNFQRCKNYF